MLLAGCRTPAGETAGSSLLDADDPVFRVTVNKYYRHGGIYSLPIDPQREVDQVTVEWDVDYSVVMRDGAGNIVRNDAGQPKDKDGVYAYGKVDGGNGLQEISTRKFVAADVAQSIELLKSAGFKPEQ